MRRGVGVEAVAVLPMRGRFGAIAIVAALAGGCAAGDGASWFAQSEEPSRSGPVAANSLVAADGLCDEPPSGAPRSLEFGMTECDVANAVGPLDRVQIGADDRGRRTVVLTSIAGARPGVYRFVDGRLASIERAPELAPPPRQQRR